MAGQTHIEGQSAGWTASWSWSAIVVTVALLAPAVAAHTAGDGANHDLLSTTLLGRLEPGGEPRLAVRWHGRAGAMLDVWVDLDGDGEPAPNELVVAGRPIEPGIEVVGLEIPAEAYRVAESALWARARERGTARAGEAAQCLRGESLGGCVWQPGFTVADLDGGVWATAVYDDGSGPALYAAGGFAAADGVVANHIARWNGGAWSALSGPSGTGVDGEVWALTVYDDGTGPALYAGGTFTGAGGVEVNRIARWNGSVWSALSGPSGTGADGTVRTLVVYDDGTGLALYAGGTFTAAGGVEVNRIARWDGGAWSALSGPSGTGVSDDVDALAVYDDGMGPALYVGGDFATAGGAEVNGIARWDGGAWSGLSGASGTGVDGGPVVALAVHDDGAGPALYAGGYFFTAGGVLVHNIARWDGSTWSALTGPSGTGVGPVVFALAVHDDGTGAALYAGGYFTTAGGVAVNHIARWDGSAWSALAGPSGTGPDDAVWTLVVYDDGTGLALYVGGYFTTAGGVEVDHIVRWNGGAWTALSGASATGVNGYVMALTAYDDGTGPALYAGGGFTTAGGVPSSCIAAWRCDPGLFFADGFESGDTAAWAGTVP